MADDYRDRLLSFIKRAEQATQAAKERAVRGHGLTTAQYNAVLVLSHTPGLTASELARGCSVTAQTMSSVLVRLVERGMVTRTVHPRHRGVLEITVTPVGLDLLRQADADVQRVETRLAAAFTPTEQDQLRRLLTRCADAAAAPQTETADASSTFERHATPTPAN